MQKRVREYYTATLRQEWRRLVRDPYHRLEYETTLHFLGRHLPIGGLVLDAGGGPGRYTLELARQGHEVVLFDLTPANLEFARRQIRRAGLRSRVREVAEGSLVDLGRYPDATFDAVICLGGPLSHVVDPQRRARAIAELARVARPGAPLLVSVMCRLSLLVQALTLFPHELEMRHFKRIRETGVYSGNRGFTACHFFLPEELRAEFDRPELEFLEMAGLEGISSNQRRALNRVARHPGRWRIWWETHLRTCTHPAVVGLSEHMLIVSRKR